MPDSLSPLIADYIILESRVQRLMAARCRDHCARCTAVCCRIDFCRESLESPFLQRVRRQAPRRPAWDPRQGWLGANGCRLPAGRPPVCYAYYCKTISAAQATAADRHALDALARLMTFVGRRARGSSHLVELSDLGMLNVRRLAQQMKTAETALGQLQRYWSAGEAPSIEILQQVHPHRAGLPLR